MTPHIYFYNIRRATLTDDENIAGFGSEKSAKAFGFGTMPMRNATSHPEKVRRCVARFSPCSKVLHFTGRKGCSKRSTTLIVRLICVCSHDQKLYMTCILSHYARCFCIRVPGKDIDFVPLGAVFLVVGCTCTQTFFYGLGINGLVMGCSRT